MGAEGSKTLELSVFVASWNMGNKAPPEELSFIPTAQYDIYAIGVQESIYLSEDRGELKTEFHWTNMLEKTVGPGYNLVCMQTLSPRTDATFKSEASFKEAVKRGEAKSSGVRLAVFVRERLMPLVDNVEVLFQACGRLGGASGNKGAVAAVLNIGGCRVAFINCHLNAHMENLRQRNQDYDRICRGLHPTDDVFGDKTKARADSPSPDRVEVPNRSDLVFWFGDLNYRIQPLEDLERQPEMHDIVCQHIEKLEWGKLVEHDQLKAMQRSRVAFHGYDEAPITFAPTFKLKPFADSMQPKERYSKERVPAYCDRVLWRSLYYVSVHCDGYRSHPDIVTSDHTPISANFTVRLPQTNVLKDKSTKWQVTLSNIILQTEGSLSPAADDSVRAKLSLVHKLATNKANFEAKAGPKRTWSDPLILQADAPLRELQKYPLIVVVRSDNQDGPVESWLLGEGMISLHDLTVPAVKVALTQGGKPYGVLLADIRFEKLTVV